MMPRTFSSKLPNSFNKVKTNPEETDRIQRKINSYYIDYRDYGDYGEDEHEREFRLNLTPLQHAIRVCSADDVELFIKHGDDIEVVDKRGRTPLHHSLIKNSIKITNKLIEAGANIKAVDKDGLTPLHYAIRQLNHIELTYTTNHHQNQINKMHYDTLIHGEEIVKKLIDAGANIEAVDIEGKTPLHYVAKTNNRTVLCLLLNAGANAVVYDNYGKTPYDHALENNKSERQTRNSFCFEKDLIEVHTLQQYIILDTVWFHFLFNQEGVHIDDPSYYVHEMSEFLADRPESCGIYSYHFR